jgi:hypothetical protein
MDKQNNNQQHPLMQPIHIHFVNIGLFSILGFKSKEDV